MSSFSYVYDAAGAKLQKITDETTASVVHNETIYSPERVVTTTTYIGGNVYESKSYPNNSTLQTALGYENKLQFLGHEEGRTRYIAAEALYRNLDPQIGRFHQIDLVTTYYETPFASMQNNPIIKKDWLGNYFTWANGGEEAYKKLRAENSRRLKEYVTELSALDLNDENNLTQISQLTKLIDRHTELNTQWNEMEESDVEFNVSLENSGP